MSVLLAWIESLSKGYVFRGQGQLERKRDDIVRSVVLQLHTAIEDILDAAIVCRVLEVEPENRKRALRGARGEALQRMLTGGGRLGFAMKINFAVALGLITSVTRDRLMELNTLRNKCSHNWLLRVPQRRGKRPSQQKPPLLRYKKRDLHTVAALKEFASEYGIIYAKMFAKFL
jgi:hypothetical protein